MSAPVTSLRPSDLPAALECQPGSGHALVDAAVRHLIEASQAAKTWTSVDQTKLVGCVRTSDVSQLIGYGSTESIRNVGAALTWLRNHGYTTRRNDSGELWPTELLIQLLAAGQDIKPEPTGQLPSVKTAVIAPVV